MADYPSSDHPSSDHPVLYAADVKNMQRPGSESGSCCEQAAVDRSDILRPKEIGQVRGYRRKAAAGS